MKRIFSKIILLLFILISVITCLYDEPIRCYADTGPKPSIELNLKNINKSNIEIGILLDSDVSTSFRSQSTDLYSKGYLDSNETYKYQYFIQINSNGEDSLSINWTYRAPLKFKFYILDKDSNDFYITDLETRYTYNSHYEVDFQKLNVESHRITLNHTIYTTYSVLKFLLRLLICLVVELIIALLFKFRKKDLLIVFIVNFITQLGLNLYLSISSYQNGNQLWIYILLGFPILILCEIIIFLVEALFYRLLIKNENISKKRIWTYAFVSNLISFIIGLIVNL